MKRLLALLLIFLTGCAAVPDPRVQAEMEWAASMVAKVHAGQVKFTDYYREAIDRLSRLPPSPTIGIRTRAYANLLPAAVRYESGEITREQFDDMRRLARIQVNEEMAQLEAADRERRAEAWRNLSNQLMLQSQIQQQQQQQMRSIHCNSYRSGNSVYTTCN